MSEAGAEDEDVEVVVTLMEAAATVPTVTHRITLHPNGINFPLKSETEFAKSVTGRENKAEPDKQSAVFQWTNSLPSSVPFVMTMSPPPQQPLLYPKSQGKQLGMPSAEEKAQRDLGRLDYRPSTLTPAAFLRHSPIVSYHPLTPFVLPTANLTFMPTHAHLVAISLHFRTPGACAMSRLTILTNMNPKRTFQSSQRPRRIRAKTAVKLSSLSSTRLSGSPLWNIRC